MKRIVFYAITLLTPIILLIALELLLRMFGYGESPQPLFVTDKFDSGYWTLNPRFAERYFSDQAFATAPQYEVMEKAKGDSTFRIFVQGASSSAGFPYHNASFPKLLEQRLQAQYPTLNVEVINTSLVATNSYAMLDMANEIINAQPDMVIIYGGHNEYYGALGVASTQSKGSSPRLVNTYLSLKKYRIVQLLSKLTQSIRAKANLPNSRSHTLMARMIREDAIPYGSDLYVKGLKQYEFNLSRLLNKYRRAGVSVGLSTLVSNLADFSPFLSENGSESALTLYNDGLEKRRNGELEEAVSLFNKAKDMDLLKFRAPSGIDSLIIQLRDKYEARLIDIKDAFEQYSPDRLIGGELMHEHVHPNLKGQRLMADRAFTAVAQTIAEQWGLFPSQGGGFQYAIAPADSLYAEILISQLLLDWPFNRGDESQRIDPGSRAAQVFSGAISWDQVLLDSYYSQLGSTPYQALQTARVMLQDSPHREEPYLLTGEAYLRLGQFEKVEQLLSAMPKQLQSVRITTLRQKNAIANDQFYLAAELTKELLSQKPKDYLLSNQLKSIESIILLLEPGKKLHEMPESVLLDALEGYIFLEKSEAARQLLGSLKVGRDSSERLLSLERRLGSI
ncbi:SGNH/GDSL hydrolase family protein [Roseivirga thermotolerans]|uniref:SGNH/GDSL hydrolase family protein n=1 Tax=Roseivirga thermotolerans TaxID=1758176 RepID=UPI00273E1BF2|nr:SGNH/GDSL hydrolase family protein [Roseivirga thermotolerans]